MNMWNTLLEIYQQRVYKNTPATVNCQIQSAENPTPAVVISKEVAGVENSIPLDYLTLEAALADPEIGSTDPNMPIDIKCTNYKLHFGMPGGSGDYEDEGDEHNEGHTLPTARQWRPAATVLRWFDLGSSEVDRHEGDDGDNASEDEEEAGSQADDGSTQNVDDWGHSSREYEDWTVYFRPVKYNSRKANALASDVSEAKTVL